MKIKSKKNQDFHSIKIDAGRYKPKKEEERTKTKSWQLEALKIIEDFNIKGVYKGIIFKHARHNMQYLLGKVTYTIDRFGKDNIGDKGRYLISLFKKKKPWE